MTLERKTNLLVSKTRKDLKIEVLWLASIDWIFVWCFNSVCFWSLYMGMFLISVLLGL